MTDETSKHENPSAPADPAPEGAEKTFSVDYVAALRREAAEWRTKLRAQEEATAAAMKAAEELKAAMADHASKIAAAEAQTQQAVMTALRVKIGAELGLPAALVERLRGDDEAALRADAEALKAVIPAPAMPAPGAQVNTSAAIPGGAPIAETIEQKRARLLNVGGRPVIFGG